MEMTVICPSCGNHLEVPEEAVGNKVNCVVCKKVFEVKYSDLKSRAGMRAAIAPAGDHPPPANMDTLKQGASPIETLLSIIEECLKRMIIGIPRFLVVSVIDIYHYLVEAMPVMVRLIRVVLLAAVLVLIMLGPLMLTWPEHFWLGQLSLPVLSTEHQVWLQLHLQQLQIGAAVWFLIASCGALWGLFHIRKKQRGKNGGTDTRGS